MKSPGTGPRSGTCARHVSHPALRVRERPHLREDTWPGTLLRCWVIKAHLQDLHVITKRMAMLPKQIDGGAVSARAGHAASAVQWWGASRAPRAGASLGNRCPLSRWVLDREGRTSESHFMGSSG